jgi:L-threonylcarbamoyladenylate synthase
MLIYRPGAVTAEMISAVAGAVRVFGGEVVEGAAQESLPSPGVGLRHYAPRARLVLVESEVEMRERVAGLMGSDERIGVMLPDGWDAGLAVGEFRWGAWGDREDLARRLFAGLRELDEAGVSVIVCPVPEAGGLGDALRDRLRKAARVK